MPDYIWRETFLNDDDNYFDVFEKREVQAITQYDTVLFNKRIIKESFSVRMHLWKHGDKFYKLASMYYGSNEFWWIIALWNGKPTDAHCEYGMEIGWE